MTVSATPSPENAQGPGGLFSSPALEQGRRRAYKTKRRARTRRYRAHITEKASVGNTGAMVALCIPAEAATCIGQAAKDLFCDRAECADDLHITLAYLGKVDDFGPKMPQVMPIIQRYVQTWLEEVGAPITARIGGYGTFPEAEEDGIIPIYRVVESPILHVWVEGLKRVLDFAGITTHRDYEPYTPHITVAYSYRELAILLPETPATPHTVQFTHVTVCVGDMQISCPIARAAYKEAPITYKKSEQISPGVYRIRGNLCQVHGKFGPCDAASSEGFDKKPKKGKGGGKKAGGGKGAKPKLSDADRKAKRAEAAAIRKQEAEAQKVQNRTESLAKLSNRPNDAAMAVLDGLRAGGQVDQAMAASMEKTGLVDKHADGSYTLSASGHSFLGALEKGDAGRAVEALAKGNDKVAAATTRSEAQAKRIEERRAKLEARGAAKLAKAGGKAPKTGPKGSSGSSEDISPAKRDANLQSVRQTMMDSDEGLSPTGFDSLLKLDSGSVSDFEPHIAKGLQQMGMARRTESGKLVLTGAGKQVITAAARGDAKTAINVIKREARP